MKIKDRKRRKERRDLFGFGKNEKRTEEKGEITNGWAKIFHACRYVSYYRINSRCSSFSLTFSF